MLIKIAKNTNWPKNKPRRLIPNNTLSDKTL